LEGYDSARQNYTFKPGERRDLAFNLVQQRGSLTARARPGTHVIARRAGQNQIDLGTVGPSGEASFSEGLAQGRWSIVFENPDCQPASPVDVSIEQGRPTVATARQSLLPASLEVRSDPSGGTIWINGAQHGNTPTVLEGLPAETPINVELRIRGRTPVTRTVTLRPRERSTLNFDRFEAEKLRLDLQPWDSLRNRRITITVNGAPTGARSINGSTFEVPLDSAAQRKIHIEAEGFQEQDFWVENVAQDERPRRVTLQPLPTAISVLSQTPGAHVWINDRGPVDAPVNFSDLAPGHYVIRIEKDGYGRFSQELDLSAGERRTVGPIALVSTGRPVVNNNYNNPVYTPQPYNNPAPSSDTPTSLFGRENPPVSTPTTPPPAYRNDPGSGMSRNDIVPPHADDAGVVEFKTPLRTDQVMNSIRQVAQRRGWAVAGVQGNVIILKLNHHGYDATVYCRVEPHRVEFLSDSYKSGGLLSKDQSKQVPTSWIKNLQQDLAKAVR